jgi:hypothetical protein
MVATKLFFENPKYGILSYSIGVANSHGACMRTVQRSVFLNGLLADASNGTLMPADMNRSYVWKKEHVETLFDSIMKKIPIGSFLLWEPNGKADLRTLSRSRLGPINQEAVPSAHNPINLLLDGQNRLATLVWLCSMDQDVEFSDLSVEEKATWASGEVLVFDAKSKSIIFVPKAEAALGLRMPGWMVMRGVSEKHSLAGNRNLRRLYDQWEKEEEAQDIETFLEDYDRACAAFQDAQVTVTVIQDATADEARSIFLRICRVGVQMSQADFDRAVGWGKRESPAASLER